MAYMSEEGYNKLLADLKHLEAVERPKIVAAIAEARDKGDLSENAEYDAAKEEQGEIETRIAELEKLLRNAEIIDEDVINADVVQLGNRVKLWDEEFEEELEYSVVGSTEADPLEGRISNESPVGEALIGTRVGDVIEVQTPDGVSTFKVLEISTN